MEVAMVRALRRHFFKTLPVFSFFPKVVLAQTSFTLEEIKVSAQGLSEPQERVAQEVKKITKEELKSFGYTPYSGLDVRERGGFGVQEDLSLRGTTFEQNLVLLEGIRISDLQTGHHLMNLPLGMHQVQVLEVLPGGASPIYGAGGFGGALNFLLEPTKPGFDYKFGLGSYSFFEGLFSLGIPLNKEKALRLTYEQRKAEGFIKNRDFDLRTFNLYTKNSESLLFYGFIEKDFGARNFYTPRFDTEWEETKTHLFMGKHLFTFNNFFFEPAFIYRKHYDNYLLNRYNPEFYKNRHTNYLYRINLPFSIELERKILSFGIEGSYESLKSSRLGEYLRRNLSFYGGIKYKLFDKLFTTLQLRWDNHIGEKDFLSLGAGLAYLWKEDVKFRVATNYSYRLPSVTELRYEALGIRGNPELALEKALNFETGLDYKRGGEEVSFTLFYRIGDNLIDWLARTGRIFAENLDVKTLGGTIEIRKSLDLHTLFLSYTYLNQSGEDLKYARYHGNYLRHNLFTGLILKLPYGVALKGGLNYQKRLNQAGAFILDFEAEKSITEKTKLILWGKNLLDRDYYEIKYYGTNKGVLLNPQWFGIKIEGGF